MTRIVVYEGMHGHRAVYEEIGGELGTRTLNRVERRPLSGRLPRLVGRSPWNGEGARDRTDTRAASKAAAGASRMTPR